MKEKRGGTHRQPNLLPWWYTEYC